MPEEETKTTEPKEGVDQQGDQEQTSEDGKPTSPLTGVKLNEAAAYAWDPNNPGDQMIPSEMRSAIHRGKMESERTSQLHKEQAEKKELEEKYAEVQKEYAALQQDAKLLEGLDRLGLGTKPEPSGGKETTQDWMGETQETTQPPVDPKDIARQLGQDTRKIVDDGLGDVDKRIAAAVKAEFERSGAERKAAEESERLMTSAMSARKAQLQERYGDFLGADAVDRMVKMDQAAHNAYVAADVQAQEGNFQAANQLVAERDALLNERVKAEAEAMLQKQQLEQQAEIDQQIESNSYPGVPAAPAEGESKEAEMDPQKAKVAREKRHEGIIARIEARTRLKQARSGQ